jgi:hypothetical protein
VSLGCPMGTLCRAEGRGRDVWEGQRRTDKERCDAGSTTPTRGERPGGRAAEEEGRGER